jgi:hypothetical protein
MAATITGAAVEVDGAGDNVIGGVKELAVGELKVRRGAMARALVVPAAPGGCHLETNPVIGGTRFKQELVAGIGQEMSSPVAGVRTGEGGGGGVLIVGKGRGGAAVLAAAVEVGKEEHPATAIRDHVAVDLAKRDLVDLAGLETGLLQINAISGGLGVIIIGVSGLGGATLEGGPLELLVLDGANLGRGAISREAEFALVASGAGSLAGTEDSLAGALLEFENVVLQLADVLAERVNLFLDHLFGGESFTVGGEGACGVNVGAVLGEEALGAVKRLEFKLGGCAGAGNKSDAEKLQEEGVNMQTRRGGCAGAGNKSDAEKLQEEGVNIHPLIVYLGRSGSTLSRTVKCGACQHCMVHILCLYPVPVS